MSSRSLIELRAWTEHLGLSLRVYRKWGWDVPIKSGLEGWYCKTVGFSQNPAPDAEEVFLGKTVDEAKAALKALETA